MVGLALLGTVADYLRSSGKKFDAELVELAIAELAALRVVNVDEPTIGNLAMLVARLVQQVRKHDPGNDVAEKAMNYLRRSNLEWTVLREIKKRIPQPESEASDA